MMIVDQNEKEEEEESKEDPDKAQQESPGKYMSIITSDQRLKMTDSSNHWKVRTSTIDEIHITIQSCIEKNPDRVLNEADSLLEFFVSLLSD